MTQNLIKIVSWNVNSVRSRLKPIMHLINNYLPDIICLQETKVEDHLFPCFKNAGYNFNHFYGQKSYNGVAILSKIPVNANHSITFVNQEARGMAIIIDNLKITNLYVPAGGDLPDPHLNPKFAHKLAYLEAMTEYYHDLATDSFQHIIVGDLNVAPLEHDVWSHKQLMNVVSHTEPEITRFNAWIKNSGLIDLPRHFVPDTQKLYSWWSYRNIDYKKSNRGRRLDHAFITPNLLSQIQSSAYLTEFRDLDSPSDHVPLMIELYI